MENSNGQELNETQIVAAVDINVRLGGNARLLWDIQKVRIETNNRISAMQREGYQEYEMLPHLQALDAFQKQEDATNKSMVDLVKEHVMYDWIMACPGLAPGGFARIVGVTGDFMNFPNVAKVWKYMGLHVVDGKRPRRERGVKMTKTTPEKEGTAFSPQGQVVAHQLGEAIVKSTNCQHCGAFLRFDEAVGMLVAKGRKVRVEGQEEPVEGPISEAAKNCPQHEYGKYRQKYDARKAATFARIRTGQSECPMGHDHKDKTGKFYQCVTKNGDGQEKSAHLHNDAMRVAIKELIKDLWVEWKQRTSVVLEPKAVVSVLA